MSIKVLFLPKTFMPPQHKFLAMPLIGTSYGGTWDWEGSVFQIQRITAVRGVAYRLDPCCRRGSQSSCRSSRRRRRHVMWIYTSKGWLCGCLFSVDTRRGRRLFDFITDVRWWEFWRFVDPGLQVTWSTGSPLSRPPWRHVDPDVGETVAPPDVNPSADSTAESCCVVLRWHCITQ